MLNKTFSTKAKRFKCFPQRNLCIKSYLGKFLRPTNLLTLKCHKIIDIKISWYQYILVSMVMLCSCARLGLAQREVTVRRFLEVEETRIECLEVQICHSTVWTRHCNQNN